MVMIDVRVLVPLDDRGIAQSAASALSGIERVVLLDRNAVTLGDVSSAVYLAPLSLRGRRVSGGDAQARLLWIAPVSGAGVRRRSCRISLAARALEVSLPRALCLCE